MKSGCNHLGLAEPELVDDGAITPSIIMQSACNHLGLAEPELVDDGAAREARVQHREHLHAMREATSMH